MRLKDILPDRPRRSVVLLPGSFRGGKTYRCSECGVTGGLYDIFIKVGRGWLCLVCWIGRLV